MSARSSRRTNRRGIASVLAMLFLSLFTILSMSMAVSSTSSVEIAGAQHRGRIAYAAAESGLQFVTHLFASINDLPSTDNPDVLDSELPALWENIDEHFGSLAGTANFQGQAVTITLDHEVDVTRGDVLAGKDPEGATLQPADRYSAACCCGSVPPNMYWWLLCITSSRMPGRRYC